MWNLISHFLTFAGGMASGVMLMCLIQTGKLADKEFETIVPLPAGSMQDGNPSGNANAGSGKTNHDMSAT